ncbi:transmembrane protein 272-like [Pelobates fuscus]|uniref:transmembrane protein 272-like n=1 Tax=Pelobates fuscus TaxID=191477 RepID=UPI002FE4F32E
MQFVSKENIEERCGLCSKICNITVQVIAGLIWTALGIAMIVVGALNLNNCPANRFIPIYLVVAGAFSLGYWILFPLQFCLPTLRKILAVLFALFWFAWFIAGSVWVFRAYRPPATGVCNISMYLFAFSILIIQYILIGLGIISGLITCCCSSILCCARKV